MKQAREKAQSLLNALDFPGEILTGIPVVEIKGSSEIVVLNHRGVSAYQEDQIRIASCLGTISISGEKLSVFRMNRERIVLHGRIFGVRIGAEGC